MNIQIAKYIIFTFSTFIFIYIIYSRLNSTQNISINVETNSPDTIVFAFDIHGVMFKNKTWTMLYEIIRNVDHTLLINILKNPSFLYTALILRYKSGVVEEILTKLAQKYPFFEDYLPIYIKISNLQKPIPSTIETIYALKNLGYKIFIFSNIGSNTFEQFKQEYPAIFNLMDGAVVSHLKDEWIQKPHTKSYEILLETFQLKPENIIFIDDKMSNITAAQELGFNTIYFTSPKDLTAGLTQLGINVIYNAITDTKNVH